jgi:hypothetical protein
MTLPFNAILLGKTGNWFKTDRYYLRNESNADGRKLYLYFFKETTILGYFKRVSQIHSEYVLWRFPFKYIQVSHVETIRNTHILKNMFPENVSGKVIRLTSILPYSKKMLMTSIFFHLNGGFNLVKIDKSTHV